MRIGNSTRLVLFSKYNADYTVTYKVALLLLILLALLNFPVGCSSNKVVDFELPDINGVQHKLSDYRGKWVLVNYWATWCPPCLEEIPELIKVQETYGTHKAVVLGVNLETIELKTLREFVDEYFINYPILIAGAAADSPLGPIPGLPTSFVVSPEGKVVDRQLGSVTMAYIETFINNNALSP